MSAFTPDWLDLRAAADARARDDALLGEAAALLDAADEPLAVDLGCGTGAMLRAFAPRLARSVRWRLVDADPALLAEAARRHGGPLVETVELSLAGNVLLPFEGATLVTASALFDLVSEAFVARLVATLASRNAALYAGLTYDGTTVWDSVHPLDGPVLDAFNRDQRRDKGFGPALGPTATEVLVRTLDRAGYQVRLAKSPWRLGPEDHALVAELARGMAGAAADGGLDRDAVDDWLAARIAAADGGHVEIGHDDLFARPA